MDPLEATWTAEHLEHLVTAGRERARCACFPVPLRPGWSRRRTRWAFLLTTDCPETHLRTCLAPRRVEFVGQRRGEPLFVIWDAGDGAGPPAGAGGRP
ncbi:MAG: hypothetical protein R3185_01475 [Candidatus Thermoplasmatota archaeon]|nr:hypothetical protein [Candidatus Thermoplasmatota archaeon]